MFQDRVPYTGFPAASHSQAPSTSYPAAPQARATSTGSTAASQVQALSAGYPAAPQTLVPSTGYPVAPQATTSQAAVSGPGYTQVNGSANSQGTAAVPGPSTAYSNSHTRACQNATTEDKPVIWHYGSDSPPHPYEPKKEVDVSPPRHGPSRHAPFKSPRYNSGPYINEAIAPERNLPPVVNGPYLPLNAHPFNSLPGFGTVEQQPMNRSMAPGNLCTCGTVRSDLGLMRSRYTSTQDQLFQPGRFTDACPVHDNEHIYGKDYLSRGPAAT